MVKFDNSIVKSTDEIKRKVESSKQNVSEVSSDPVSDIHRSFDNSNSALSSYLTSDMSISSPSDASELEAVRVSDEIMSRGLLNSQDSMDSSVGSSDSSIMRSTSDVAADSLPDMDGIQVSGVSNETISRKLSSGVSRSSGEINVQRKVSVSSGDNGISRSLSAGSFFSMPKDLRSSYENAFGTSFAGVRVHNDANSDRFCRSINADACTHGRDMYFKSGFYNPSTSKGQRLIAHELTHVAQNSGGISRQISEPHLEGPHTLGVDIDAAIVEEYYSQFMAPEEDGIVNVYSQLDKNNHDIIDSENTHKIMDARDQFKILHSVITKVNNSEHFFNAPALAETIRTYKEKALAALKAVTVDCLSKVRGLLGPYLSIPGVDTFPTDEVLQAADADICAQLIKAYKALNKAEVVDERTYNSDMDSDKNTGYGLIKNKLFQKFVQLLPAIKAAFNIKPSDTNKDPVGKFYDDNKGSFGIKSFNDHKEVASAIGASGETGKVKEALDKASVYNIDTIYTEYSKGEIYLNDYIDKAYAAIDGQEFGSEEEKARAKEQAKEDATRSYNEDFKKWQEKWKNLGRGDLSPKPRYEDYKRKIGSDYSDEASARAAYEHDYRCYLDNMDGYANGEGAKRLAAQKAAADSVAGMADSLAKSVGTSMDEKDARESLALKLEALGLSEKDIGMGASLSRAKEASAILGTFSSGGNTAANIGKAVDRLNRKSDWVRGLYGASSTVGAVKSAIDASIHGRQGAAAKENSKIATTEIKKLLTRIEDRELKYKQDSNIDPTVLKCIKGDKKRYKGFRSFMTEKGMDAKVMGKSGLVETLKELLRVSNKLRPNSVADIKKIFLFYDARDNAKVSQTAHSFETASAGIGTFANLLKGVGGLFTDWGKQSFFSPMGKWFSAGAAIITAIASIVGRVGKKKAEQREKSREKAAGKFSVGIIKEIINIAGTYPGNGEGSVNNLYNEAIKPKGESRLSNSDRAGIDDHIQLYNLIKSSNANMLDFVFEAHELKEAQIQLNESKKDIWNDRDDGGDGKVKQKMVALLSVLESGNKN